MPEAVLEVPKVKYTDAELAYRGELIRKLEAARLMRDSNHTEFDDMDYLTRYQENAKAANAYIRPKKNKIDTRIVTGTTREKENTLLSALLNYNLEPNVEAFDKDDLPIAEIGETMEAMIKKSREIENYDDKRPLIYKEGLDQGDAFCEEVWIERSNVEKALKGASVDFTNLKSIKWTEKLTKVYGQCEAKLKSGTQVLLGNVKEFDEWLQPFIATIDIVSRAEAESVYGEWERWKNVPLKIVKVQQETNTVLYRDWSLVDLVTDTCEIIKFYDKWSNEMMILINGEMMLPIKFPLTAVSPSGEPPIGKLSIEPISKFFAYSNSIPSKTKVDQALFDEMLRNIVTIFQQKVKPPMANNTGRALSERIFDPGRITDKIDPTKLQAILANQGMAQAEFAVFDLIKKTIDEKTISPTFAGEAMGGTQTATEIVELKKQAMMKLGSVIWGVIRFEKRMAWLRIHNILENWTNPIDNEVDKLSNEIRDIFRTMTVKTPLENGQMGRKIIEMNPEMANQMTPEHIQSEENFISQTSGIPTRKIYLHPEELKSLKANWFITITPTEKDSTALDRTLYTQNLTQAAELFGVQSLNIPYHKRRFAILAKEDPDQYFLPDNQQQGVDPNAQPVQVGAPSGIQTTPLQTRIAKPQRLQMPSLNTLTK